MKLIFSVDENWAIGYHNDLLFRAKGDMAHFRRSTTGKTVVMGYHTLLSMPGGKPLPNRRNIVLSTKTALAIEGAEVAHSLPELFGLLRETPDDEVYIIGGEQVYRLLTPYANEAVVTRFYAAAPMADRFLPDLEKTKGWRLVSQGEMQEEDGLCYSICIYRQDAPLEW